MNYKKSIFFFSLILLFAARAAVLYSAPKIEFNYENFSSSLIRHNIFSYNVSLGNDADTYYAAKIVLRGGRVSNSSFVRVRYAYLTLRNFGNVPVYIRFGRQNPVINNFIINKAEYGYDGIVLDVLYKFVRADVIYLKGGEGIYEAQVGARGIGKDINLSGVEVQGGKLINGNYGGLHYYQEVDRDTDYKKNYLGFFAAANRKFGAKTSLFAYSELNYMFGGNRLSELNAYDKVKYRGLGANVYAGYEYKDTAASAKIRLGYKSRGVLNVASESYVVQYEPYFYSEHNSVFNDPKYGFSTNNYQKLNMLYFETKLRYKGFGMMDKAAFINAQRNGIKIGAIDNYIELSYIIMRRLELGAGFGLYLSDEYENAVIYNTFKAVLRF